MELGINHSRDRLEENNIVTEVKESFLEYSMSVIVARAIPDLRDGLKPVHRRILYSMYETGLTPDKQHRKSAKVVGDVMGNYHPHGDSSIYDAMVRLAQDFSYRYPLVDGHGNFGNIEGSSAAASRYTEVRMGKLSLEMVRDLNKNTVNMVPNYDETSEEPTVLPSRYPNILVNGTMGIAVGMATNIPPHNLREVINGCIAYIDNPEIDTMGLMQYIKGPDFPNGGIILGNSGIKQAYETGRGTITVRSKAEIVEDKNKTYIVITQIPFGITTSELKNKVAELAHNKTIEGIADYHTDLKEGIKDGVKITITLKHDANPQVVLNQLYKHTPFQSNFSIILLMLDNGTPKTLGLKDIIAKYIDYQKEVIIRRTKFDLDKTEKRVHILEGLKIALDNIDEVIKVIKAAKSDEEAKAKLEQMFGLTQIQSEAILEMKLRRLTGLERNKIENELEELRKLIEELRSILASEEKLDLLNQYYLFLTEYNKHTNLTAITDEYEVYLKHFYDSLLITKEVDLSKINNILDIGSGAGFPGVVLKIFFPNINLTVIDSNNKKTNFLKELTYKLNLDVEVINDRVENLPLDKYNSYDLVVSRAVAFVDIITSLSLPFIKKDGKVLLMKGSFEEEEKVLNNYKDQLNIKDYKLIDVSYFDNIRKLVIITKLNKDIEKISYSKIIKRNKKWKS